MPLSDLFAALRWWAALTLVGIAITPLCLTLLRYLPDRGYAFVKMAGLLLLSYLFWILGSLGLLANNLGGILFCLLLVGAGSYWAIRRSPQDVKQWLHENWRYVLTTELLFALIFFFWAWVRAQNPAITGTEKPMEFAFLNAVGRSTQMPPLDPWLSGYAISYYYFGYVMTSIIARLALVPEPLAFNLGVAWLAAGAAIGAFGIVYNLAASEWANRQKEGLRRGAIVLGLIAALALPFAGNMQILLEQLHANGVGSPQFWSWLDIRDINGPPREGGFDSDGPRFWWWWRSSRVIHEYHLSGVPEEGLEPIAEFPGFSFILGDMHPHVLALPFAFLSLGLAFTWWLKLTTHPMSESPAASVVKRSGQIVGRVGVPLFAATTLLLGGLSFLNTWDVLIHLFIILATYVLARWRSAGGWQTAFTGEAILLGLLLALPAILLYLPFYLGFRSQAGAPFLLPMLMRPTRLAHYLVIFAMPFLAIIPLLATMLWSGKRPAWRSGLLATVLLPLALTLLMLLFALIIAPSPEGSTRLATLAGELGVALPPAPAPAIGARLGWAFNALLSLAGPILAIRLASPWLVLFLAIVFGASIALITSFLRNNAATSEARPLPASNLPFVLLLIVVGVLLTIGPEFVYLRDNFGQRLNTVFKFYYQAWVLFGISALAALAYLRRVSRPIFILSASLYGLAFAVAMLFPIYGISSRAQEYAMPSTLDGIAHYTSSQPGEYAALQWLRQNIDGEAVILEAVGGQYSPQGHGRISASTGLPTLVGWAGHQYQWRGTTPVPAQREQAVETIYTSPNWPETAALLDEHHVSLIYVGALEENTYGPSVRSKFESLDVAYENDSVIIYFWGPD